MKPEMYFIILAYASIAALTVYLWFESKDNNNH